MAGPGDPQVWRRSPRGASIRGPFPPSGPSQSSGSYAERGLARPLFPPSDQHRAHAYIAHASAVQTSTERCLRMHKTRCLRMHKNWVGAVGYGPGADLPPGGGAPQSPTANLPPASGPCRLTSDRLSGTVDDAPRGSYFPADADLALIDKMLALLAISTFAAAVVAGLGASVARAGESTGNCGAGQTVDPFKGSERAAANCKGPLAEAGTRVSNGNSWCSYSGQNDHPEGSPTQGPGGRSQSYGQDVSGDFVPDPSTSKGDFPSPGTACNPNDSNNFGGGDPPLRK